MTKPELEKLLETVRRPMYKIERDLGMPMNTIQRAVKGTGKFPKKWVFDLKEYVKTGGWISANLKEKKKSSTTVIDSKSDIEVVTPEVEKSTNETATAASEKTLTYFQKRQRGLI